MRVKIMLALSAALLIASLIVLPRIIEAKRSRASNPQPLSAALVNAPNQDTKNDIVVGASVRNDTSKPLREMKQKPMDFRAEREANENPRIPLSHKDEPDTAVQRFMNMPSWIPLSRKHASTCEVIFTKPRRAGT